MIANRLVQFPFCQRSTRRPRLTPMALFSAAALIFVSAAQAQNAPSAEGQAWLRTAIAGGHSDLRWADFSDYSKHLKKFYDFNGDSFWWVQGMEPTPQARRVIALLLQADQKGLSASDYDGDLWGARLAKLKPATRQPTEADALKFDLDLTVCVMRYISDLHIGKVNPKHFAFALDEEPRKYDLPEFLRDRVVNANDAAAILAQVEPPYPGYRNTVAALQTYMKLAAQDDGEQLPAPAPPKKAIAPGDAYPGVPRLIRLLRLVGDLPVDANIPAGQQTYDAR
jgi:L,D-transpeptidase YcbB